MLAPDASSCAILRHLLATLAYRSAKVLRDATPSFGVTAFGTSTRTPVRIVAHMADLMFWGVSLARGESVWSPEGSGDWDTEVRRFLSGLEALDRALVEAPLTAGAAEKLIQGPLADALTHTGQLSLLRGLAGMPVRPENYARATVVAGCLGFDQAPPVREFDDDASARRSR